MHRLKLKQFPNGLFFKQPNIVKFVPIIQTHPKLFDLENRLSILENLQNFANEISNLDSTEKFSDTDNSSISQPSSSHQTLSPAADFGISDQVSQNYTADQVRTVIKTTFKKLQLKFKKSEFYEISVLLKFVAQIYQLAESFEASERVKFFSDFFQCV